jgi:hypothetical protein
MSQHIVSSVKLSHRPYPHPRGGKVAGPPHLGPPKSREGRTNLGVQAKLKPSPFIGELADRPINLFICFFFWFL